MAVCVDRAAVLWRGRRRHHLAADTLAELHAFAARVGIRRCWFHNNARHPHYDVTDEQRAAAIVAGALEVDERTLVVVAKRSRVVSAGRLPVV
jgi:hypothetical protein